MSDFDKPILQITWTVQDVFEAFQEHHGREPTETELDECIGQISVKAMQDTSIETGWDFIYQSIRGEGK